MRRSKSFATSSTSRNNSSNFLVRTSLNILVAIVLSFGLFVSSAHIHTTYAQSAHIQPPSVNIRVNIGEGTLDIFGYGPPLSKILLEGRSIYAETTSNTNGYFEFNRTRIRIAKQEVCISALLSNSASTQPVCVPIPAKKYVRIGPIILPPALFVNQLAFDVQDAPVIRGSTVPQSEVKVKFFSSDTESTDPSGVAIPIINTRTGTDGTFTIGVPANIDQRFRFYALTSVDNAESGKSNTLTIDILPLWMHVFRTFTTYLSQYQHILPILVIISELGFLIWFFFVRKKKKSELMIVEQHPLLLEKHELVTQNKPSGSH